MSANQTQIPVIQTGDESTQIQQNVNKVLRNINNQVISLTTTVNEIQGLGDIILSPLTLSEFQTEHSDNWIIANGQSSTGTAYQTLTLKSTVPNITVSGATAYIKVN